MTFYKTEAEFEKERKKAYNYLIKCGADEKDAKEYLYGEHRGIDLVEELVYGINGDMEFVKEILSKKKWIIAITIFAQKFLD